MKIQKNGGSGVKQSSWDSIGMSTATAGRGLRTDFRAGKNGVILADDDYGKVDPSKLPDENLFKLCKTYGGRVLLWRQKFIGLLPEVFKRKLFEKKGFGSIFEFAKKLAGLSEEQVRLTLNLEKRFENLPELKSLLVNGEVSVNKLARVASIASLENQRFLAENVRNLSQVAVETLVRDEKWMRGNESENFGNLLEKGGGLNMGTVSRDGLFEAKNEAKSLRAQSLGGVPRGVRGQTFVSGDELGLSPEVKGKLIELKEKGIDVNELLLEFLQKREVEIAQKKEQIREEILRKEEVKKTNGKEPSHHIPKAAEKILDEEYGAKCAVKGCKKLAMETHHMLAFAVGKTHDPKLLIRLCKGHHELQHAVNLQYGEVRRGLAKWAL